MLKEKSFVPHTFTSYKRDPAYPCSSKITCQKVNLRSYLHLPSISEAIALLMEDVRVCPSRSAAAVASNCLSICCAWYPAVAAVSITLLLFLTSGELFQDLCKNKNTCQHYVAPDVSLTGHSHVLFPAKSCDISLLIVLKHFLSGIINTGECLEALPVRFH